MQSNIKSLLLFSVIFVLLALWYIFMPNIVSNSNIAEWGIYTFIIPLIFTLFCVFSSGVTFANSFKIITAIFMGIFISLLLSRDISNSFLLQKMAATLAGGLIALGISKLMIK